MSNLIAFIIIAVAASVLSSSAKKRKANEGGHSASAQPNARRARTFNGPQLRGMRSFTDLIEQFDQLQQIGAQREQVNEAYAEGTAAVGSMHTESTEGQDTPGHDHGFQATKPEPKSSRLPERDWDRTDDGLRSPRANASTANTLRQAVILTEILGKPVSQRRRT